MIKISHIRQGASHPLVYFYKSSLSHGGRTTSQNQWHATFKISCCVEEVRYSVQRRKKRLQVWLSQNMSSLPATLKLNHSAPFRQKGGIHTSKERYCTIGVGNTGTYQQTKLYVIENIFFLISYYIWDIYKKYVFSDAQETPFCSVHTQNGVYDDWQ